MYMCEHMPMKVENSSQFIIMTQENSESTDTCIYSHQHTTLTTYLSLLELRITGIKYLGNDGFSCTSLLEKKCSISPISSTPFKLSRSYLLHTVYSKRQQWPSR